MCLRIKKKWFNKLGIHLPKRAKQDIVVYKFYFTNTDGSFRSPFMEHTTFFGMQQKVKFSYKEDCWGYHVAQGYHSVGTIENTHELAFSKYVIVKCIIPKGARYYEGVHDFIHNGYVSNKLELQEIVYDRKTAIIDEKYA